MKFKEQQSKGTTSGYTTRSIEKPMPRMEPEFEYNCTSYSNKTDSKIP